MIVHKKDYFECLNPIQNIVEFNGDDTFVLSRKCDR